MEKYGLSVRELEAQSVELLPERVEMKRGGGRRRLRWSSADVKCRAISIARGNQRCTLQD